MKKFRILSLGAGVQSTTIALRIAAGKLPGVDAAIFADTGEEPAPVYEHLNWLVKEVSHSFPVMIRQKGSRLGDDLLKGENGHGGRFASIPAFTKDPNTKDTGVLRRQCTKEKKLEVIDRTIRREILGLKPRQHIPADVQIEQVIGLSAEESRRVLRVRDSMAGTKFVPDFPLWNTFETRANCKQELESTCPHEVMQSACTFCPFRKNQGWRNLKERDPAGCRPIRSSFLCAVA